MLCQFTVQNFQCIKDELTLDMQATSISENEESLLKDSDDEKFLPLAVIYGPNGTGKTTVLLALNSLICKVMRPVCASTSSTCDKNQECLKRSEKFAAKPFAFSDETINAPTVYELFFRTKTTEYQYNLSVLKEKILSESLYKKIISGKRYTEVFSRNKLNITLKGSLKKIYINDISENLTLLSYLAITHRRNKIINDTIKWFDDSILFLNYDYFEGLNIRLTKNEKLKKIVIDMLKEMDFNINNYRIEEKKDKENRNLKIYVSHPIKEKNYELELKEESSGTIKIFSIIPHIAKCMLDGVTLIVDELDSKLHPLLLKYIIQLFSNPNINKKNAQLIFTSHDLSTMNSDVFRRDEVWFIAMANDYSSKMYSLVDFKTPDGKSVRKDARFDKQYLEGKYGADPYFKRIINWEKIY